MSNPLLLSRIDPAIIAIGQELHPEKPYASPRVQVINNDARSFLATTNEKYDVIAFGLLDSLHNNIDDQCQVG